MLDRTGKRKYLNWPEREAFFRAVSAETDVSRKSFCLTLFFTGCRISEALELTWDRIDFAEKSLVFETLKRRRKGCFRAVPIPDTLVELLKETRADEGGSERIWPFARSTGYRLIRAKMKEAKQTGAKASPKGLRHSFAIACISRQVPLNIVQKWLGHARLQTTAIYLDAIGEEERKLAERLWKTIWKTI